MRKTIILATVIAAIALMALAVYALAAGSTSGSCPMGDSCPMDAKASKATTDCPKDPACCPKDVKSCPMQKAAVAKTSVTCPVMGRKVADTKTALKSAYKGKTYYFCCAPCKTKFDKNPASYLKSKAQKEDVRCPVMGGKVANPKSALKSDYKGKTYYFCCPGCKPKFDANPQKYVKPALKG